MKTLNEKLSYLAETKAVIKDALVEQGQTVTDSDSFRSYADKIKAIDKPTLITDAELELDFSSGDMPISAPDGYAFTGGTIKKPETLVPENIAKDVEVAGIVGTHEGGGGGTVAGTVTITFCNHDGTVLYSRLVFTGDDCPDPIAQGKINEPTRESTTQYSYAYDGWSLTKGGTTSASALNVVMEDRTVYAAFVANVRYYTVRFYDGTTLMKEMQVAYGSVATEPETSKDGYNFVGWTPSDLTIYADTDFYGTWKEATYAALMSAPDVVPNGVIRGSAFYGDDTRVFVAAPSRVYAYDVTGDVPTKTTDYSLLGSGGAREVAICADGQVIVATEYVASTYKTYGILAHKVTSSNNVTDSTSTFFGKSSTWPSSFYNWDTCCSNHDGSRLLLSASGGTFIYDCTTTPFTLLQTLNSTYKYAVWGADNDTLYYPKGVNGKRMSICKYTLSSATEEVLGQFDAIGCTRFAMNHDLTKIAVVLQNYISGTAMLSCNTVVVFDLQTKEQVATITLPANTDPGGSYGIGKAISYSPDGKALAVACKGNVYFCDVTDDKYTLIESTHVGYGDIYPQSIAYNSSGNMVAVGFNAEPYFHLYKIEADETTQTVTS